MLCNDPRRRHGRHAALPSPSVPAAVEVEVVEGNLPCTSATVRYDPSMAASTTVHIDLEVPTDLARLRLPEGLDRRLQALLDKQDRAEPLTEDERAEAEGLVELSELLTVLRLRAESGSPAESPKPTR